MALVADICDKFNSLLIFYGGDNGMYKYIDGGVCAAKGFKANGLNCGLNPNKEKNDL